jgi:hypothetical protein
VFEPRPWRWIVASLWSRRPTAHNCAGFRLRAASATLRANFRPVTVRARHGPRQAESSETPYTLSDMAFRRGGRMYRKFGLCVLTLGLPVLGTFAFPASAQVVGTVVTEDGQPIPGALVELRASEEVIGSTTTDTDGRFALRDGTLVCPPIPDAGGHP